MVQFFELEQKRVVSVWRLEHGQGGIRKGSGQLMLLGREKENIGLNANDQGMRWYTREYGGDDVVGRAALAVQDAATPNIMHIHLMGQVEITVRVKTTQKLGSLVIKIILG
jgi:hypothetical protein